MSAARGFGLRLGANNMRKPANGGSIGGKSPSITGEGNSSTFKRGQSKNTSNNTLKINNYGKSPKTSQPSDESNEQEFTSVPVNA